MERGQTFGRIVACAVAVLASLAGASLAQAEDAAPERLRVVVYGLRPASPELEATARRVTSQVLVHLGRQPELVVIGEAELEVMLAHVQDRASISEPDCLALDACLARLQGALEADKLITGHLGRMGSQLLVTFSLSDARRGAVERASSALAEGEEALVASMKPVLDALLGLGGAVDSSFSFAPERGGTSLAVLPLQGHDTRPGLAESLTQLLSVEVERSLGVRVITREDVIAMLDFTIERQRCLGDSDLSCLIELGGALGADHLVAGAVSHLGQSFVIHLALLDIGSAHAAHRVIETYRGPEAQLPRALRFTTAALFGRSIGGAGDLEVLTSEPGTLELSGADPYTLPLPRPIAGLPAGKLALSIRAEDHHPYHAEVYIEPDLRVRFEPELIRVPTPWYRSWVFWTVASVVAAGATTASILLLEPPKSGRFMGDLGP